MHTVGGVVSAGEPIMLIVPEADALTVEAKLAPQDIDQVRVGQSAALRFSAFNQRTTPELNGVVSRVSADITTDQRTGAAYYMVRITLAESEIGRLGGLRLVPGMPVEAFIQNRRAHRALLRHEAVHGPDQPRLQRAVSLFSSCSRVIAARKTTTPTGRPSLKSNLKCQVATSRPFNTRVAPLFDRVCREHGHRAPAHQAVPFLDQWPDEPDH